MLILLNITSLFKNLAWRSFWVSVNVAFFAITVVGIAQLQIVGTPYSSEVWENFNIYSVSAHLKSFRWSLPSLLFIMSLVALFRFLLKSADQCLTIPFPRINPRFVALIQIPLLVFALFLSRHAKTINWFDAHDFIYNELEDKRILLIRTFPENLYSSVTTYIEKADSFTLVKYFAEQRPKSYTDGEKNFLIQNGFSLPDTTAHRAPATSRNQFTRIVVISVESLALGYFHRFNSQMPDGMTPFINDLMVKYPSSQNYLTNNLPTDNGLTSTYLSQPHDFDDLTKAPTQRSIFSILRSVGFKTKLIGGVSELFANHYLSYPHVFNIDRSDIYLEERIRKDFPEIVGNFSPWSRTWGLPDEMIFKTALKVLNENKAQPILLAINTIDTHPPYYCPDRFPTRDFPNATPLMCSLWSFDQDLKVFFEKLNTDGLFDEHTLIVFTADHSPTYGENNDWIPEVGILPLKIPLIFISKPKDLPTFDEQKQISQIDLAPTILSLLNLPIPEEFWGTDIFSKKVGNGLAVFGSKFVRVFLPDGELSVKLDRYSQNPELDNEKDTLEVRALRKWIFNRNLSLAKKTIPEEFNSNQADASIHNATEHQ